MLISKVDKLRFGRSDLINKTLFWIFQLQFSEFSFKEILLRSFTYIENKL